MANYDTKISFGVDLKGAESAQKALDDLSKKAIDNAKKQADQATVLADELAKVAEEARVAAEEVEKSGAREDTAHKKRVKDAKAAAREKARDAAAAGREQDASQKKAQRLEEQDYQQKLRRAAALEREHDKAQAKQAAAQNRLNAAQPITAAPQGAFTQGLVQGAIPGNLSRMIDRGPGAFRQAAGIMSGQALSSLASIPFTGVGGLLGAAGAFGSMVGAPIERLFGNTGSALERQRSQLSLQPFLGGYGMQAMSGTGGIAGLSNAAIHARALQQARNADPSTLSSRQQDVLFDRMKRVSYVEAADVPAGPKRDAYLKAAGADQNGILPNVRRDVTAATMTRSIEQDLLAQRARDRSTPPGFNPLERLGRQYGGLDITQTQAFVGSQAMRAGGQGGDLAQQGLIETGLAANVKYGIGANVSGAFGRAGRIGGIVGGKSEGSDRGLARVIGNAVALGLTGSDLTRATERMADILGNFETSGMPLAAGAIGSAAAGFGKMGLSAPLAQAAGVGLTTTLQNIGDQGPQDAFGIAAMQALGGDQSYEGQLSALEELRNPTAKTSAKVFSGLARRVVNGGKGRRAHAQVRTLLSRLGAPHDDATVATVQASIARGDYTLPGELQNQLSPEDLQASAKGLTGGALSMQADAANRKANLGEAAVGASQAADATADALAKSFSTYVGPVLSGLTDALNGIRQYLQTDAPGRVNAQAAAADGTQER